MNLQSKKKVAVIFSGGGTKSMYCIGAISELHKKGIFPDIIIAGSGSVGIASYYVAGQLDSLNRICERHLSTSKFINIFRIWKVINIDYLT